MFGCSFGVPQSISGGHPEPLGEDKGQGEKDCPHVAPRIVAAHQRVGSFINRPLIRTTLNLTYKDLRTASPPASAPRPHALTISGVVAPGLLVTKSKTRCCLRVKGRRRMDINAPTLQKR